jgi:membrane protease YdiL (CAAX protease family)
MNKKAVRYLAISYVWTWAFWLFAFFLSKSAGHALNTGTTLFDLFSKFSDSNAFLAQLIFALAVFGPLVGYLIVAPKKKGSFAGKIKAEFALLALIIPIASAIPSVLLALFSGLGEPNKTGFAALSAIALYFVSNLLTSGTEEFGWRGFLYPNMKEKDSSFWHITLKSGLIWALWHYPLMIMMYWEQGPAVLLPSLAGFTAGIVAMTYIANFIYEKTSSIGLSMFLHALNNTMSFAVALLFPKSPFAFLSSIVAWAVVGLLDKKYQMDKKKQATMPAEKL